ncbi:MAG: murein biosynthesis integral membrane protein MurJ [Pseudomonadota bacterium]
MKAIRLGSAFLTVGVWTLASRVLGFLRDILIAAFLGSGPVAEAFLIAFALPNMFRRFFAEGAFNMAFVPMFSKKLDGREDALGFAEDAFSAMAAFLTVFTLIALALMPWLVLAMAGGFAGDGRLEMATLFGRIAFPYILFISLAALLSGVLNASGRFVAAAAAPVLLNVIFVVVLVAANSLDWSIGLALSWAVPLAGVAQLGLVWQAAARAGFALRLKRPALTPDLRRLAIIAAPAALAGGVVQVNLLIGRQVASFFDGAIVWLSMADRLYQLPLGVVGIAIGVVLLPDLSRRLRADDTDGGRRALARATEISIGLTLPAAVALAVIPEALVSVLFERGAFTTADTAATALALAVYAVGLPAFVLQKVLQPLFFAREDTRRPFYYALAAMVINAGVAIGLAPMMGYLAAALGTSVAGWAMVILLWRGSRGMGHAAEMDTQVFRRLFRVLVASIVMGAALWLAEFALSDWLVREGARYIALSVLVALGVGVYGAVAIVLGAISPSEVRAAITR